MKCSKLAFFLAVAIPAFTTSLYGDKDWTLAPPDAGSISDPANWGGVCPTAEEIAYLRNGGTATIDADYAGNPLAAFVLGDGSANGTINQTGGLFDLTAMPHAAILIGGLNAGPCVGTYNISGGTLSTWEESLGVYGRTYFGYGGGNGIMNVSGTATVKSRGFIIGYLGASAVNQTGGTVSLRGGSVTSGDTGQMIGLSASGYYGISGGLLEFSKVAPSEIDIGFNAQGFLNQTGGDIVVYNSSRIYTSSENYALAPTAARAINLIGGTFTEHSDLWYSGFTNYFGACVMTIDGGEVVDLQGSGTVPGLIIAGNQKQVINVGDCTIKAGIIKGWAGPSDAVLNLHGGTIIAREATYGSNFMDEFTHAYLYSEGIKFQVDSGHASVIAQTFEDPSGYGLTNASISASGGSGYVSPPLVTISGGSGSGATGYATIDSAGQVTGIVITNPGTGYALNDANPFTVTFEGGGGSGASATIDASQFAAVSGGVLTKTGPGKLSLAANQTYAGATVVQGGTLELAGIAVATSGITVKSGATLAGYDPEIAYGPFPDATVEAGGSIAASLPASNFTVDSLSLENNSSLSVAIDSLGYCGLVYANQVSKVGTAPITVNVSYSGTPLNDVTVLQATGALDTAITFALPGGLPTYDSTDAIHGEASIYTDHAAGTVQILAADLLADVVPTWNDYAGGDWNDTGNWGTTPPNPYPQNGGDRAMFVRSLGYGPIPVNLNVSPTLSSMIFDSPLGESYQIDPSDSGKSITMDSSIAKNWYISVLSGSHTVNADIKMAAEDGQAMIKVPVASQLTLGGALSGLTTAAGFTFQSTGTLTGNQWDNTMAISHGVLTLGGNSSFTGPLTMAGYGRLEMLQPTSLGTGTAALTLDGQLAYLGAPTSPTTVAIDRNVVFAGNGFLNGVEVQSANVNLNFTGSLSLAPTTNAFRKTGLGALTFSNAGTNTLPDGDIQVEEGALNIENGTFDKARVNIYFQNGAGDFFIADTAGKNASLTIDKGATLISQSEITVGSNAGVGTLTVTGDSQATFVGLAKLGFGGTAIVNVDGTSAEQHSTLTCSGAAWLGAKNGDTPSLATINLTGYGEMHNWGSNTHMGSGAGNHVSFNVSDHAKFVYEGTNTFANDGLVDIGDYGASADVVLNDFAAFENPHGYVTIGGNVEAKNLGGAGSLTLNDSATFTSARTVCVGDSATTGVLTLNGGVVTVPALAKGAASVASTINFNGGTLKASIGVLGWYDAYAPQTATGLADFIQGTGFAVNVHEGGAKFDTNALDVTVTQVLAHAGTAAIDGGLTKLGDGSLTLTALPTYTGDTTVNQGTLNADAGISTPDATVYVADGATLNASSIVADTLSIGGAPLAAAVPEPGTLALLALAVLGIAFAAWRRR